MDRKKKILVVDDRETWLHTIDHILGNTYKISLFTNTLEARKAFSEEPFDLVILDKNLAGESGLDLLINLRRIRSDLRAIILTQYEDVESAVHSMKLGALDYVPKGTSNLTKVLRDKVQEALDSDFRGRSFEPTILELIAEGESATLEFKSSFRWDLRTQKPSKELEKATIKTIAAFMNSDSKSDLLLGVADNGKIVGLHRDFEIVGNKKDRDSFENFLMSRVLQTFGKDCAPLIQISFHRVEDDDICQVKVSPSPKPMFLKDERGEHFFVRAGNSTRSLTTREAIEYCRIRWD